MTAVPIDETAPKAESPKAEFPDLTKIDRTIVKEPRYATQPYYALLAIGPQAQKRVWLVVDGETLYVDKNGDGDLTEANERIGKTKQIEVAPGLYCCGFRPSRRGMLCEIGHEAGRISAHIARALQ